MMRGFSSDPHVRFDKILMMVILILQEVLRFFMCAFMDILGSQKSPRIRKLLAKSKGVSSKVIRGNREFFFC